MFFSSYVVTVVLLMPD
jgi:hypothetical protein